MTASSAFALTDHDALYCDEEPFDDSNDDQRSNLFRLEESREEDDHELARLLLKESEANAGFWQHDDDHLDRSVAVEWLLKLNCYFDFGPLTCVLAVDYFDRFVGSTLRLKKTTSEHPSPSPWMPHLLAVACLSLAAKMEEVEVPLLLDLQVEESKYVFEAKTVQRMELLILSTLNWKMNPVTPICYFNNIFARIPIRTNLHWEFLWRCERLLLSVIADSRCKRYAPSVLATVIMLHAIQEIKPSDSSTLQNQLMDVLKLSKEKVDGCYKFFMELLSIDVLVRDRTRKWRYNSAPSSPSAVINVSFSCESSNDSWEVMASTFGSSSEPPFKRSRARDQSMRFKPSSSVSSPWY